MIYGVIRAEMNVRVFIECIVQFISSLRVHKGAQTIRRTLLRFLDTIEAQSSKKAANCTPTSPNYNLATSQEDP